MKHQLLLAVFFIGLLTSSGQLFGQKKQAVLTTAADTHEKCGTSQRHDHLLKTDPNYAALRQQGENHYQQYLKNPVSNKAVVTIPVVVHVIHTGQAVGTGVNISDAQIQSAIDNLNDAYSNTSTAFTTYTGVNTEIQFCLAQRDPSGNPTTGIVRVDGSGVTQYSTKGVCSASGGTGTDNEQAVKALSKWDKTLYYNIWVVNEIDDNGAGAGTQGYAYFPGAGSAVDGTIILFNSFGYDPDGSIGYNLKSYTNKNVTTVHEIGHALNLYHTFQGDGTGSTCPSDAVCGTSGDCVADTPPHKRSNSDCLINTNDATCGGVDRDLYVHNFMDYSSDVCQTEFTAGQSTRMNAALANFTASGRGTLTTSDGCVPANNALDASITTIVSPISSFCQTTFSPIVTLRNFGTTTLTSATITYNIDGGTNQVFNWTGSLVTGATENVTLDPITTTAGAHTINVTSSSPNGGADEFTTNDANSTSFTITASSTLPFSEDFEGAFPPASWTRTSGDVADASGWDVDGTKQLEKRAVTAESDGTGGSAMAINGYGYQSSTGNRLDEIVTPSINIASASAPALKFQVSHAYFNTTSNTEALKVYISTDCGVNYTEIYNKSAATLATNGQSGAAWAPTNITHWREETLDLSAYVGNVITLKFETFSNYGNNLYVDKINITDNCTSPAVTSHPSNSTNCAGTNTSFTVSNTGGGTYQWQENNGGGFVNVSNGGIYSNATTATLNLTGVTAGMNTYTYRCVITNGCGSVNSNNATLTVNSVSTPTISAGGATTFCSGASVTLTSSAASGNTWSTGETTQAITVSSAGTYTVTVTASGCSATSAGTSVTVNASPATPTISAGGATTFCNGGSVTLTSSSATDNTWSTGATTQSLVVSTTGSYTVTVTVAGCSSTSTATAVNVNAIPTISIGTTANPSLCGLSDGSIEITGSGTGTLSMTGSSSLTLPGTTLPFVVNSLAAGTYNFTFDDGCTSGMVSHTLVDPAGPATPTISASGATTFCNGGSVTLTSSSASGNTWSTGATTQSITASTSGTYTVTVASGACTATSAGTVVTVNALPTIAQGTVTNPSACVTADGSIEITGSGTGNLTWTGTASGSMNGVSLPATVNGLGAGSYNFSFDDGCVSNTLSVSLSDPGAPATPTISADGPTNFCDGSNVTLTSSSASNNVWSNGATTQSIVVTTSGNYSVTVTVSGCSATSSTTTVDVNPTPTITVGSSADPSLCGLSDGSILINGSAITGTLNWLGNSSGSMSVTLPATINSLPSGSYDIDFSDAIGCFSGTISHTLNDPAGPATPTISAGGATTFCAGGSVTLTSSSASGNTWSTGATTQSITVSAGGTYTVTVTSGTCSATSVGTTVTVNPLPTISQGTVSNPSACATADGSIEITGSGTGNLTWTGTASGSMNGVSLPTTVNGLGAGSYNFSFDDLCGTSNTLSVSLSDPGAPATPTISASGATTFCAGGSVTLTSSSATDNMWSSGETTQSITVSAAGNYSVTVTVAGCSSTSATTSVTVNTIPVIAQGSTSNPTACGALDGSVEITGSGTGTLSWTGTASGSTSGTLPLVIGSLGAGSYNFSFDDGCVSNTVSATLSDPGAPATPSITASGATTFCDGGTVTLTSSSATDNVWSTGDTGSSIVVTTSGTYTLSLSVAGCVSAAASVTVTVNPLPATPIISSSDADNTICNGETIVLTSSAASGNTWSTTETTQSINVTTGGSYTVTVSDGLCSNSSTIGITVNPVPVIALGTTTNPTACGALDGSVEITGSGTGTLSWTGTASGSTSGTLPLVIGSLGAGSYNFSFDDGCVSNTVSVTLSDPGAPATPSITASGVTTFCDGGSVTLTSSSATDNVWSTGDTGSSIVATTSGTYTLSLSVAGCVSASASVTVTVNPLPILSITAPDVTLCDGIESVNLSASVVNSGDFTAPPVFIWSPSTGLNTTSGSTVDASPTLANSPITYTVNALDPLSGCTSSASTSASVTITVLPLLVITAIASPNDTLCLNDQLTLTASGSGIGQTIWTSPAAFPIVINGTPFTADQSGDFTFAVTAFGTNGCPSAAPVEISIHVNPLPTVTLSPFATMCDTDPLLTLSGGTPSGGTFTVNGVPATEFNPATAIIGNNTVTYSVTDGNGCMGIDTVLITVDDCVGIDENSENAFVMYPNPTSSVLYLKSDLLNDITSIELRDELGRNVAFLKLDVKQKSVDLSSYSAGIYTLVIKTENTTSQKKVQVLK